jgi:hypothetical protein
MKSSRNPSSRTPRRRLSRLSKQRRIGSEAPNRQMEVFEADESWQ